MNTVTNLKVGKSHFLLCADIVFVLLCLPVWFSPVSAVETLDVSATTQDAWTTFDFSRSAAHTHFRTVQRAPFVDRDGRVWWGVDGGVLCFDGKTWQRFTHQDGLLDGPILSITQTQDGTLWFAGRHQENAAMARFDGLNWKIYSERDGLTGEWMGGVSCVDTHGNLWVASEHFSNSSGHHTGGYGVFRFDGSTWRKFTTEDGLVHNRVYDIASGSDGRVWFATRAGLSVFDGMNWVTYNRGDGMLTRKTYRLCVAQDGSVWCTHGDRGGISVLRGETWTHFEKKTGMPVGYVRAVFQSDDGAMWFGTNPDDYRTLGASGLFRFKDGMWLRFTREDGLPWPNVEGFAEGSDGTLWLHAPRQNLVQYQPDFDQLGTITGDVEMFIPASEDTIIIQVADVSGHIRATTQAQPGKPWQVMVFPGQYRVRVLHGVGNEPVDISVTAGNTVQAGTLSAWWNIPSFLILPFGYWIVAMLIGCITFWRVSRRRRKHKANIAAAQILG